ncbi:hypothetical protein UYSO10_4009 [Kosakonia radicincitans]|nr:hypothetical protein UYSO10_4009 [Kosakonia radicincitans]
MGSAGMAFQLIFYGVQKYVSVFPGANGSQTIPPGLFAGLKHGPEDAPAIISNNRLAVI